MAAQNLDQLKPYKDLHDSTMMALVSCCGIFSTKPRCLIGLGLSSVMLTGSIVGMCLAHRGSALEFYFVLGTVISVAIMFVAGVALWGQDFDAPPSQSKAT